MRAHGRRLYPHPHRLAGVTTLCYAERTTGRARRSSGLPRPDCPAYTAGGFVDLYERAMMSASRPLKALFAILCIIVMNAALGDIIHDRGHFV